jgi:hypothetical protein
MTKQSLNRAIHIHNVGRSPAIFLMKALSSGLSAFPMQIVSEMLAALLLSVFIMRNVNQKGRIFIDINIRNIIWPLTTNRKQECVSTYNLERALAFVTQIHKI